MKDVKLSIIMPVYNEVNTVLEVIRLAQKEEHKKEIIIVDDASTDGTRELLQGLHEQNVKVFFNEVNKGKGYCIRKAIKQVTGDIVIIQDADLEYYPDEYGLLIEKILEGKADVVYGSRFLGAHRVFNFHHYLGNLTLNLIANILLNTNLTDLMTCYKAFRTSVIKNLKLHANRFGIETEITAEVFKRKNRVYEVPISYNGRTYEEGKKIKWPDFFRCLYWLLRAAIRGINVGEDTLLRMQAMKNNNLWTYNKIKSFLGEKVLELGSGIGTFSKYIIAKGRRVTLTDINETYISYLRERFISNPWVKIIHADITNIDEALSGESFDSVVGINILEHIDEDIEVIKKLKNVLVNEGRVVLIVPAHKILFSSFDKRLEHYRRYSKEELLNKLKAEGFLIERLEFMNALGALGWFFNFRILQKKGMSRIATMLFDRLIPWVAFVEKYVKFPFGLSLLCVAKIKKE